MEGEGYRIQWVEEIENHDNEIVNGGVITTVEHDDEHINEQATRAYIVQEITQIPNSIDQIAAENLIYMAQDGQVTTIDELIEESVEEAENIEYNNDQQYFECQVTEEVITDDWVQQQGEERVEIPVDQICGLKSGNAELIDDIDVPLPTDQDEYTALRPYPCDFCSRRFRKKVSLMNHMVAHQNDRPNVCNLCGARYIRKTDLLNHLKTHAHIQMEDIDDHYFGDHIESRSATSQRMHYIEDNLLIEKAKPKIRGVRGRKSKIKNEIDYTETTDKLVQSEHHMPPDIIEKYPITDPRKPFICQQCGLSFAREKALLSHTRIHGGDSPYECTTCNEMFWDINLLNEHQRTHHFEASNSEYEPENDEPEESESDDSKYGEYYCNVCGMSFHRQDLLKRHTKTHIKREIMPSRDDGGDDDSTRHCCNVCGETFAEALDLLAHAEIHARFQPFKCTLCGETFLEEETIKKHLNNAHAHEMSANSCILCGKLCKDSKALMKHAWDHSREKNHSCSKCGKNFHNKARLKRHMMSHRNKSVTCEVCKEEFPDGRSLMNHRHSHNNSPGRQFPCYECGKTFGSRSSQQIHVRIHTGERPYGCRYCWKAFADGGTLRKHERIHTGEKPYACSVCPRAFNQRVVLREHIRAHHSALDATRGTYFCTVCSSNLSSSTDLIQHLIQHSDMNTAMQRQPVTGPRKYKRRRKLKPHELMKLRHEKSNQSEDIDYSDLEMSQVDDIFSVSNNNNNNNKNKKKYSDLHNTTAISNTQNISNTSGRNRKYSGNSDKITSNWQQKLISPTSATMTTTDDTYNGMFQNIENALNNIDPLVVNSTSNSTPMEAMNSSYVVSPPRTNAMGATTSGMSKTKVGSKRRNNKLSDNINKPSRPKMIHTQKTRVTIEDGKRKTRTLVTRTEPTEIDNIQNLNSNEYEMIVPDVNTTFVKQEQAPTQSDLFNAQLLLEAATMRKDSEKFTPDVINDLEEILRSPIKTKSPEQSQNQQGTVEISKSSSTVERKSVSIQQSKNKTKSSKPTQSSISIRQPPPEEDLRRSARLKRNSMPNKKYLEYDMSPSTKQHQTTSPIKIKQEKLDKLSSSSSSDQIKIKIERDDDNSNKICLDIIGDSIKSEYFSCEMCSEKFPNRNQLLDHVPVHI